jgi:hypothetical protein
MSVLHPSSIRPFLIFRTRHHVSPNASSSKRKTALLPNDGALPTAGIFTECFKENFLSNGAFLTKLGPQVSLFSIPILGVNSKYEGDKSIELSYTSSCLILLAFSSSLCSFFIFWVVIKFFSILSSSFGVRLFFYCTKLCKFPFNMCHIWHRQCLRVRY